MGGVGEEGWMNECRVGVGVYRLGWVVGGVGEDGPLSAGVRGGSGCVYIGAYEWVNGK